MFRLRLERLLLAAASALVLVVLGGCGGEREGAPAGPSSGRVTVQPAGSVEGAPLGYVEYVPPGYGDGSPRPLLIFLHGSDENGDGSEEELDRVFKLGVPMLIDTDVWPEERPFVVLMPQYGPYSTSCRLADEIADFLRFAIDRYEVDESRVYLTGVSCGATGAWDYFAAHRDAVVAAAVLISGRATSALEDAGCSLGHVPTWAFHGAADDIVPQADIVTPVRELRTCTDPPPADLRLTVYPDAGHDAWSRTYDLSAGHDVFAWLLGHENG